MNHIVCNIVGFSHHAWQGDDLDDKLKKASGKRVVLTHDPQNVYNPEAIMAYIDTLHVAYVSDPQCHMVYTYCQNAEHGILEGTVTEVREWEKTLCVEVAVPDYIEVGQQSYLSEFDEWNKQYSDLPLMEPTDDEKRLCMLAADLEGLLSSCAPLDQTLHMDLDAFMKLTPYDPSFEMTQARNRIYSLMMVPWYEEVNIYGLQLENIITLMGSDEEQQMLVDYVKQLASSRQLESLAKRYHNRQRLEEAVKAFPLNLHLEYTLNPCNFFRMVYYRRVPREVLRRFLTAVLLYDAIGSKPDPRNDMHRLTMALNYVGQLDGYLRPAWHELSPIKMKQLLQNHTIELGQTKNQTFKEFNKKFVCQVVGTLKQMNIYRADVRATELTARLEGSKQASQRNYINEGVSDKELKNEIQSLWRL